MTCIVGIRDGSRVYMGGDDLTSFGSSIGRMGCGDKVFRNGDYVIGGCGDTVALDVMRYTLEPPPKTHNSMDKHMRTVFTDAVHKAMKGKRVEKNDEGSKKTESIFLVAYQGYLYSLYSNYSVCNVVDYDATGSGLEVALGSLASTEDNKNSVERIKIALRASAKYCMGVSGPFLILGTDGFAWRGD